MDIEQTNQLTANQIQSVRELEAICLTAEQLQNDVYLSNEINVDTNFPCFYLGYENEKLVAFLTTFIPTSSEAEILAFTHPEYRSKGFFKQLFDAAKKELLTAGFDNVLLVTEPASTSGAAALSSFRGAKWDRSEYRMTYTITHDPVSSNRLTFNVVDEHNKELFAKIDQQSFSEDEVNYSFVEAIINAADRVGFIAYSERVPIGVFNLNYHEDHTFLYGVGILCEYRGNGYGKELIKQALNKAFTSSKKVVLDVDSNNPVAYQLYRSFGFETEFQVDYYRYHLEA